MLKTRMRRLTARNDRAVERLAEIEASITSLGDEDLLDIADIFRDTPDAPLGNIAQAEMRKRNIAL